MFGKIWAAAAVTLALVAPVAAQEYPSRPIQLIVNFGAGGSTDTVARLLAERMGQQLGENVVVINRGGAGGTIGVAATAETESDGYTIGTANMPALAILPQFRELPYNTDAVEQIAAVLPYDYGIFARKDAPFDSWDELVTYAKENPGVLTYGSVGAGTTNHLMMERIAKAAEIEWRHVPFQGGAKAVAALVGGHVDLINNTIGPVLAPVQAGKVKPILVTSERRFKSMPEVPTVLDEGFDFAQVSYMSLIAPTGIDPAFRSRLEAVAKAAVEDPELQAATEKLDLYPVYVSGAEYEQMLDEMRNQWGMLLKELGMTE